MKHEETTKEQEFEGGNVKGNNVHTIVDVHNFHNEVRHKERFTLRIFRILNHTQTPYIHRKTRQDDTTKEILADNIYTIFIFAPYLLTFFHFITLQTLCGRLFFLFFVILARTNCLIYHKVR